MTQPDPSTTDEPSHLSGGAGTAANRASTGFTIWFTGLSGSGKSTVTALLERDRRERGLKVEARDGGVVGAHLTQGLGFSREDRLEAGTPPQP